MVDFDGRQILVTGSSIIRRLSSVELVANMRRHVTYENASAATGAALQVDGSVVKSNACRPAPAQ